MRRAIARGRVFPQSYSTDRRIGRLSLKAWGLFSLMWVNGDDQGRLSGDPEEVKYTCCPNIDHITKTDIPELLKELEQHKLIKVYITPKSAAIQMLDWWDVNQKMQWAYPSDYPPPEGWQDRLRYKKGREQVITLNWDSGEHSPESPLSYTGEHSGEHSGEQEKVAPLTTPYENKEELEDRTRRGRGRSPEHSGESPSPSSVTEIYNEFVEYYEKGWGLKTDGKSLAQIRDLSKALYTIGCPVNYVREAFREAASANKLHLSYVRVILLDWLGIPRSHSP